MQLSQTLLPFILAAVSVSALPMQRGTATPAKIETSNTPMQGSRFHTLPVNERTVPTDLAAPSVPGASLDRCDAVMKMVLADPALQAHAFDIADMLGCGAEAASFAGNHVPVAKRGKNNKHKQPSKAAQAAGAQQQESLGAALADMASHVINIDPHAFGKRKALSSPVSLLDAAPVNVLEMSPNQISARLVSTNGPGSVPGTVDSVNSAAPSKPDTSPDALTAATGGYPLSTKGNNLGRRLVGPMGNIHGTSVSDSRDGPKNTLSARLAGPLGNVGKSSMSTGSVDTPLALASKRAVDYTSSPDRSAWSIQTSSDDPSTSGVQGSTASGPLGALTNPVSAPSASGATLGGHSASPLSSLSNAAGAGALKRQVDYTTSPQSNSPWTVKTNTGDAQSSASQPFGVLADPAAVAGASDVTLGGSGGSPLSSLPHGA